MSPLEQDGDNPMTDPAILAAISQAHLVGDRLGANALRREATSLYQRRMALHRRAAVLQENEVIDGFTRTAGTPANRSAAGYAVKIDGTWTRLPGLAPMEALLADLWNGRR